MIHRTIREWESIGYGDGDHEIPMQLADQLAAEARASAFSGSGGQGVLEHGRKGLRARGVVGVIASPDCQLEILPKIEGIGEENSVDNAKVRSRLIDMIAVAHDIRIDVGGITSLGWQRDTILEMLIRLYCSKLAEAVRQGLPQQYRSHEDDFPALRGRLNVTRQFSTLAVSPHKLACRFDARSPDIALNQVMLATICKLSRLAQASDNLRILRELRLRYADIREVAPDALRWDRIVLDRTTTQWRELVDMAKLFLDDRQQKTTAGPFSGYALLFEMNVLFEKYVARLFSRTLASYMGLSASAQGGLRPCLFYKKSGQETVGRFETRPDLIVRQGGQIILVVDTKWKRIKDSDPKQGVSQADVYQLMAYRQLYKCDNIVLLYPHHGELPTEPGIQREYSIASPSAREKLFVATLDVTQSHHESECALGGLTKLCTNVNGAWVESN